jgi:glycosyltransferase involved in cell wall biosynthesis
MGAAAAISVAPHVRYIAISHYVARSSRYGKWDCRRLPSKSFRGMPDGGLRAADRGRGAPRLGTERRYLVLLTVGRLVPQRSQRYLIEAMPDVLRAHPHAQLLIVGMGFLDARSCGQVDALGLASSVRFLERREDVPALMVGRHLRVPVLFEDLGVSLLEACASGLPCVVSDVDRCRRSSRRASPACSYLPGPQEPRGRDQRAGVRSG